MEPRVNSADTCQSFLTDIKVGSQSLSCFRVRFLSTAPPHQNMGNSSSKDIADSGKTAFLHYRLLDEIPGRDHIPTLLAASHWCIQVCKENDLGDCYDVKDRTRSEKSITSSRTRRSVLRSASLRTQLLFTMDQGKLSTGLSSKRTSMIV